MGTVERNMVAVVMLVAKVFVKCNVLRVPLLCEFTILPHEANVVDVPI